jgi:N-acetylmuramoyl-L-alanine amidase
MRVPRRLHLLICFFFALGWNGCLAPVKQPSSQLATLPVSPAYPGNSKVVELPIQPAPAPVQLPTTEAAPFVPAPAQALLAGSWIPWSDWTARHGFGVPRRQVAGNTVSYHANNASGSFIITVGSAGASYNGINLSLGFPPRMTNEIPFIHSLDLSNNFTPLVASFPPRNGRILVLDPGHGGENLGAQCVHRAGYEKDFALDWALRSQALLSQQGWSVHLTRTNDVDLPLAARVAFADSVQADLFLSLHFNSAPNPSRPDHGGLETYCLTPFGMPSTLTREFPDDPTRSFPNNSFDCENLQYAWRLHRAVLEGTGTRDRGIRRARFMTVLQGQNRPAVLVEGGYLTDPRESRLIASPAYRQKLAEAVAKALAFQTEEHP